MSADRVVEHLDVVEHDGPCRLPTRVDPPLDPLLLQCTEEVLGHRVFIWTTTIAAPPTVQAD
jgi:hypothetical protein